MTLFCVGTGLAAIAPGFMLLLLARIVQASGTAIMLPLLITTVLTLVPERGRGAVMGTTQHRDLGGPCHRADHLGTNPADLLVAGDVHLRAADCAEHTDLRCADAAKRGHAAPLEPRRALGAAIGAGFRRAGLRPEPLWAKWAPADPGVSVPLLVGAVALAAFLWRQTRLSRTGEPLLDLRAFRFPVFTLGVGLMVNAMMALFGGLILLPLYLQNLRGLSTLQTGLLLLPGGLIMGLCAPPSEDCMTVSGRVRWWFRAAC